MHKTLLDPGHKGFHGLKKTMELAGAKKNPEGLVAKTFFAMERIAKHAAFECEECGDCFLSENFGFCTMGGCAKGLANAPCGDAKPDGTCGNEEGVVCRGEQIYLAAKAEEGGLARLRTTINNPRNASLEHSSSILNYLFGKDHTMKNAIITIGEDIHASIPKHGAVMRELHNLGEGAYENDSPQLDYVRALIENQAAEGADYIAINVDDFGDSDPQLSVKIMVEYVKLVRKWGGMVPACIDSSNDDVLIAGLKEWYNTDAPVKAPLVNSIKTYTADNMMPLKKDYDFSFIGLLMSEEAASAGTMQSVDDLVELAKEIFGKAMEHGFKAEEIFFDSTVFPLAIDMPMQPGVAGYTYRAFETIKAIKNDPAMKGVHFSMGVSNCCRDLPGRRIGIARAYVQKAMECGLDAGIVNAAHKFGAKPADPKLVELVEAYAAMDGDLDKTNDAIELMGEFCESFRK
ncbi:methylenetetrahydrofolate reductase C-terminal domain-containing protein [Pontiella sulfatireligans]|uniref:Methionine synthase n=1 Tax=Pontiella sulfatireligans TaxID=2750658 RepID=A0A6C2UTS0_9BACT|nr:methylenetetrahydrofolate reductase C-terminal domain-containing protein [Pontiella sulfatireligans]VGO23363.1 Methionine synthase [Pontiella sulfatireligans]